MRASSLDRVNGLVAKLRLALKHNMPEAEGLIIQIFREWDINFSSRVERKDILFDTLIDVPQTYVSTAEPETLIWAKQHRMRTLAICKPLSQQDIALIIDLQGLAQHFGWGDAWLRGVVTPVIERLIAYKPESNLSHRNDKLPIVVRRLFSPEEDLARRAELWALRARIREGRTFELRRFGLPEPMENAEEEDHELDPIIDRLIELGMTMDEVKAEFMEIIESVVESCRPQFMVAFVGAKCFEWKDREGKLGKLLREKYLPFIWENLANARGGEFWPRMFKKLQAFGMMAKPYEDKHKAAREAEEAFYRNSFIQLLSEGKLVRVFQLVILKALRVHDSDDFSEERKYIRTLVPEAFAVAYEVGRFGIAAALAQHFGAQACADKEKIREAIELALDLEQPITLIDQFVHYHMPSWPKH